MIGFFSEPYPDELAYSWFARFYQRSGYPAYIDAIRDLYERKTVRPDVEFINPLNEDAMEIVSSIIPFKELVMKHTMFPFYGRFLPVSRRQKAYRAMLAMKSDIRHILAIPTNRNNNGKIRYARYCPLCANEDRERYGETYIHRSHQLVNVDVCYRHCCYLSQSTIPISGKASPRLYVLDSLLEDMDIRPSENETEIKLAGYVTEAFQSEVMLDNPIDIGDFLHAKMSGTPYRSVRGQQRNISLLYSDYMAYYRGVPQKGVTELWQIQKILNGYRWNTYDVCKVAMFLGISVNELVNMTLPEKSQEQIFDERVKELHNQGLKYPAIARKLGASVNTVKPIGEGRYGRQGKPRKRGGKVGAKSLDWDKLDEETLPLVKEAVDRIYHGKDDGGRPRRVTVNAVQRMLNLPGGRLRRMPKCMAIIRSYEETQEEFWAREIAWAVTEIEANGEKICWRSIRDKTNLRKDNFLKELSFIKKSNPGLYEKIYWCM